jgi:RIO-like serine/threonine protein kinase
MEKKVVKEFIGHSGCEIFLVKDKHDFFVRKNGNVERNVERLIGLHEKGYNVPTIFDSSESYIEMEYIHGLDIVEYLKTRGIKRLGNFIIQTIDSFAKDAIKVDYVNVYDKKLDFIKSTVDLPFTKNEIIDRLPTHLPKSTYHGDFTLENLIFNDESFTMIDPVTIEYDSYVFDLAKLRQDLTCKWFLRNKNIKLDVKLQNLEDYVFKKFGFAKNDYLLILMLLRVYLHTEIGDSNREFILKEIKRLWK